MTECVSHVLLVVVVVPCQVVLGTSMGQRLRQVQACIRRLMDTAGALLAHCSEPRTAAAGAAAPAQHCNYTQQVGCGGGGGAVGCGVEGAQAVLPACIICRRDVRLLVLIW